MKNETTNSTHLLVATLNYYRNAANDIPQTVTYFGQIQGIVHALFKEAEPPKLVVRELSTGVLVDCYFKPEMYHSAIEVLEERDAIIFVEGKVSENMVAGEVESIDVMDFRLAPAFDLEAFQSFIGSVPNLTGAKTTEERPRPSGTIAIS